MKIDLYLRVVLSVIAVSLIWIGIQLTPTAQAGSGITRVDIVKINGHYLPNTGGYSRLPVLTRNETSR